MSVVLEPTCRFSVSDMRVHDCHLLEEDLDPPIQRRQLPAYIKYGVERRDGSDIEQFAWEIKPDVVLLGEDPSTYPPSRLERWVRQRLTASTMPLAEFGIAHLHETGIAEFSGADRAALIECADAAAGSTVWFLTLAYAHTPEAVERAGASRNRFDSLLEDYLESVVMECYSCAGGQEPLPVAVRLVTPHSEGS